MTVQEYGFCVDTVPEGWPSWYVSKSDYDLLAAQHDLTVQLLAEAERDRDFWKSLVKRTPGSANGD